MVVEAYRLRSCGDHGGMALEGEGLWLLAAVRQIAVHGFGGSQLRAGGLPITWVWVA